MNKRFFSILAVVAILFSVANLWLLLRSNAGAALLPSASVPQQINYQGRLADSSGNPLNDQVDIRFCLYGASTGGSTLWCETYATVNGTAISVTDGVFSVQLGSITPMQGTVFDTEELYLGVKVNNDQEMTPRRPITSVGYAYRAADADTVDGMHASDFAPATYIPAGITVIGQTISMNSAHLNSANHIVASRWMARATTKIKKLGMGIYSGAAGCDIVMGIYNENSSQLPEQLLGVTSPRTLSSRDYDQENLFTLTSAVSITQGQYYWIAWNGQCSMNVWDADPSQRAKQGRWANHTYNGTLPTFFHSGGGGSAWVRKAVFGISGE